MLDKNQRKFSCLALIARNHGLETLRHIINGNYQYEIIAVFTHKFNPKVYDPEKKIRMDFQEFVDTTSKANIPLYTIDSKDEKIKLEDFAKNNNFDFLISISWRYIIPPQVFNKALIGSINLHRGDLPKYAGVEPIKKTLENNKKEIAICSHIVTKNIDEGEILCKAKHPVNYDKNVSLEENVERLKNEITSYFPQLTIKSLELLSRNYEKK